MNARQRRGDRRAQASEAERRREAYRQRNPRGAALRDAARAAMSAWSWDLVGEQIRELMATTWTPERVRELTAQPVNLIRPSALRGTYGIVAIDTGVAGESYIEASAQPSSAWVRERASGLGRVARLTAHGKKQGERRRAGARAATVAKLSSPPGSLAPALGGDRA